MAKKKFIKRQLAIIACLRNKPRDFEGISDYLLDTQLSHGSNFDISLRTFQRDCKEIESIWGVEIKYNKRLGMYEIVEDLEKQYNERILEVYQAMSAFHKRDVLGDYLHLEQRKAKGTEHLLSIGHAIQNSFIVCFVLNSYWSDATNRQCVPIAVKESLNRYYLIGYDLDKKEIRNYGLDRITDLEVTQRKAQVPQLDVKEHYKHALGIETYAEVSDIELRFDQSQLKYLQSLPIHTSQKITVDNSDSFKVELRMHPTNELIMELLKYGSNCEVIKPVSFREQVLNIVQELNQVYSIK